MGGRAFYAAQLLSTFILLVDGLSVSPQSQVESQLGYVPSNFVRIAASTAQGDPVVLQTYPLAGGSPRRQRRCQSATPFPTLFWLCNASVNRAVADLERRGYVKQVEQLILESPDLATHLAACHEDYAKMRWNSLSEDDRSRLPLNVISMLRDSGIAGAAIVNVTETPSIKCLHAHYAHFRATSNNPAGEIVHTILQREFPSLDL